MGGNYARVASAEEAGVTIYIDSDSVLAEYLEALADNGLYGHTPQDAARRLIEAQLQALIKERNFLFVQLKAKR